MVPLAAALLGAPALPSTAAPTQPGATVSGTLVELVADDFEQGSARSQWALQRGKARFVALTGVGRADVRGLVGEQVVAKGVALGRSRLAVEEGGLAAAAGATADEPAAATGATGTTAEATTRVAVVMVTFADDPRQPVTPDQLRATMFGSSTAVDAYYRDSSDGRLGVSGDVFGWYTVERPSSAACDYAAWGNAASAAATSAGVSLAGYDNVMYFWPQQGACSWAGLAQLPGTTSWINGSDTTRVLGHELAHNLGENHASAAGSCVENGASIVVPRSTASCTTSEYGDPFSIMGSSSSYLHTGAARTHWGWLEPVTTAAGEAGTWTLAPLDATAGTRMVRIPRGDGTFLSLEYRQPQGVFDTFGATSPVATGVTLRLDTGVGTRQTVLFDANPATATYGDAPLASGRSVTDPLSGATITVGTVSSTAAQVSVSYGGSGGGTDPTDPTDPGTDPTPPPSDTTAPTGVSRLKATVRKGVVILSWRAATDDSGPVDYEVVRAGLTARTARTSWSDTPGAGTWVYTVVANDAAGNASPPAQVSVSLAGGTSGDGGNKPGRNR